MNKKVIQVKNLVLLFLVKHLSDLTKQRRKDKISLVNYAKKEE